MKKSTRILCLVTVLLFGLFTALLWGSWMIISCGGMTKYIY